MPDLAADRRRSDFYFVDGGRPRGRACASCWPWCASASRTRFGLDPVRDVQVLCPMNRGGLGRAVAEHRAAAGAEPAGRGAGRAVRLDLRPGRQGDAGRERLRPGRLQRRPRRGQPDRPGGERARSSLSTAGRSPTASASWTSWCWPTPRRSTRARARNIPAVVIPLTTQHYAMLARNLLYTGRDPRQAAGRAGRAAEGAGDRGQEPGCATAVVEAAGMAGPWPGGAGGGKRHAIASGAS